jgi:hypothetical protein
MLANAAVTTLEPVLLPRTVPLGSRVELAFRPVRPPSQPVAAKPGAATALVILSPGSWFVHVPIEQTHDGIWRLQFVPPRGGTYLLAFDAPGFGLDINNGPHFAIEVDASAPRESGRQ